MTNSMKLMICGALAAVLASGCGNGTPDPLRGTVSLALTSSSGSTTYRLSGATFDIAGQASQTITPAPDDATVSLDLAAGDYTITLHDGWQLESSDSGAAFAPVNAVLESPASQTFSIHDQEVTSVRYSFRVGSDVMQLGAGRLVLEIGVDQNSAVPTCHETSSSCGQASIDCWGPSGIIQNACRFSTGPDGTTVTCDGTGVSVPKGFGVAPDGYGDALRQLADLQARLIAYFESHGQYPVSDTSYTPSGTCCGAQGVFQCPANPAAWQGVAPWSELGFEIDTAHSFVFNYSGHGDTAWVSALGDLDCDGQTVLFNLSCTSSGSDPACHLSFPTACGYSDYE